MVGAFKNWVNMRPSFRNPTIGCKKSRTGRAAGTSWKVLMLCESPRTFARALRRASDLRPGALAYTLPSIQEGGGPRLIRSATSYCVRA
jgi:hypothetical protein